MKRSFSDWELYISKHLYDTEYTRGRNMQDMLTGLNVKESSCLHLSTSIRSFRSEKLSAFVKAILDVDIVYAKELNNEIKDKYPFLVTRDLNIAKSWVKMKSRGTERYGVIASSGALRLKPAGIFVKNEISASNWFLNGKDDVRSSFYLEDSASEFDIQGLELDYAVVAWDADLKFDGEQWTYNHFNGSKWQKIANESNKIYLKNAYRVLLTRARQGMIIFIPEGTNADVTRKPEYYNKTFEYLTNLGIKEIKNVVVKEK